MFESHELTPQEEQERKDDLRKQEERAREFKNRLEIIRNLGSRKGIAKKVMKEWMKEMDDTFMRNRTANWELYHDEGWEKVAEVLTEMEDDLKHGVPIIETTGRIHSILPKFQAASLLKSVEALYPRRSQSNSSVYIVSNRNLPSAFSASAAHEHVEKETHYDYPAMFAANTARAIDSIQTPRPIRRSVTGHSSQIRAKKIVK